FHWARQSFGVLQLFKAQTGCAYAVWVKRAENWFFLGMNGLLMCTFLEGVRCLAKDEPVEAVAQKGVVFPLLKELDLADGWSWALHGVSWALLIVTCALGAAVVVGYVRAERRGGSVAKAALYLAAQTVSGCLAIAYLPLYLATLAMHYVEYHVVMAPRCF